MERKAFISNCGLACLGGALLGAVLEGCMGSRMVEGRIEDADLVIPISDFEAQGGRLRKYLIIAHERLKYPVCVYRFGAESYTALLMRCTHQGTELQVFGDHLECPAHGSEFNDKGEVVNGPADTNLRTFPVSMHNDHLYISLK